MTEGEPTLSVIVPLYNEEESVKPLSQKLLQVLRDQDRDFEIIFVDDGSTDRSFERIREASVDDEHIHGIRMRRNNGKSAALQRGFHRAEGKVVATLDADLQDDPSEIPHLLAKLDEGLDLVVGWKIDRKDPLSKTLPSKLFNFVVSTLSGVHLHDMNSGLKVMRAEVAKELRIYGELHRYIPVLASVRGFSVGEIPVKHHARAFGSSKFGLSRMYRGFMDLITVFFLTRFNYRPLHVFGGAGIAIFLSGLGISVYMGVLRLQGEAIGNRPLLLLGVLLVLVGIQMLSLGLLAEMIVGARASAEDYPIREQV